MTAPIVLVGLPDRGPAPYRIVRDTDASFIVGRNPSGISAVVLRRGGKLVTVTVPTLLDEAQRLDQRATYTVTTMPNPGTTMSFTWRGKKPTKRKGAKKR